MYSITYKAPAKVILSGEHSVVYGKPALIMGFGKYIKITVTDAGKTDETIRPLLKPVMQYVKNYIQKRYPYKKLSMPVVNVENHIPLGRGLGSSAAGAVALTAALFHFYTGKEPEKQTINSIAYTVEKQFHGTPSGADNTTCCYGGLIYYRKEFEFLKTISALHSKLPAVIESHLLLIDSGKPKESTSEMVKQVRLFYNAHPDEADDILCTIEKATKRMVVSVMKEDMSAFRSSLHENELYLEKMGVVSTKTQHLLQQLSTYGTGKITGAGGQREGSGYILFFADDKQAAEAFLKEKEIPYFQFTQDFHGVQYQESS